MPSAVCTNIYTIVGFLAGSSLKIISLCPATSAVHDNHDGRSM